MRLRGGYELRLGRVLGASAFVLRRRNVRNVNVIARGCGPRCRGGRGARAMLPTAGWHQDSVSPVGGEQGHWVDATGHAEPARVKDPE
eukprot:1195800-Pleurochrysis_carterae.AAC.1